MATQSADILLDGTQDQRRECDGVSIGIGFKATRASIGAVVDLPQPGSCRDGGVQPPVDAGAAD